MLILNYFIGAGVNLLVGGKIVTAFNSPAEDKPGIKGYQEKLVFYTLLETFDWSLK